MTTTEIVKITAQSMYPRNSEPILQSDPPKGCALVNRPKSAIWPELQVGSKIEIETTNHWIWWGEVVSVQGPDSCVARLQANPESGKFLVRRMPLPPVIEGQPYLLPYVSGDAWSTEPKKGAVIRIGEHAYKATAKPKRIGIDYAWQLEKVADEKYAVRAGKTRITDLTDPNESSRNYVGHNVGRIVEIRGEFLHVKKVERQSIRDDEGDVIGYVVYGAGNFVPTAKAKKLREAWTKKETIRSLELELRVANQDIDYGGNPEAIPGITAKLEAAKKA